MSNSVEKHRRHLCIGQSVSPSQWPKDIKNLQGNYIKEIHRILEEKKDAIGYKIKLTLTTIKPKYDSEHTADWYLFPDQIKVNNVNKRQIGKVIDKLFVHDPSIIKIRNKTKVIEEQLTDDNDLPVFYDNIKCTKLFGLWILVCCHYQRDRRCGKRFKRIHNF